MAHTQSSVAIALLGALAAALSGHPVSALQAEPGDSHAEALRARRAEQRATVEPAQRSKVVGIDR